MKPPSFVLMISPFLRLSGKSHVLYLVLVYLVYGSEVTGR